MAQPFRVIDGDDPGRDRGGWDENGNVDLPGVLTVDTVKGSGSSTPALTTVTFQSQVSFLAAVAFTATVLNLTGASGTDKVVDIRISGNTQPQFDILANGKLEWGDGTAPVGVNLFRDGSARLHTTNDFATEGNLVADVAGKGLIVREGTNARMGRSTLVAGTVVVANTSVTANTEIFLTCQTPGGTPGFLRVSARTAATSFTILSSSGTDTSVVAWLLLEPAS